MDSIVFYAFSVLVILSGAVILFTKNVLYAALSLVVCLLGVAAVYVFSAAEFLAVAQVMVYVGGVLVLTIFAIMLTRKIGEPAEDTGHRKQLWAYGLSAVICVLLCMSFNGFYQQKQNLELPIASTNVLGINLMTFQLVPFEAIAILLLVALIGAGVLSVKKD